MTTHTTTTSGAADLPEALYADAVKFAKERASISYVQRKCRCSYNKAERMLEQMVADGIIQTYNWRKDAALTAQAISEAPDHVADLGNMVERAISAEPAAHVQNPAENEHVADDMSKNGAEIIMSTQPVAQQGAAYAALPEPLEIDWPELHSQALGCGVEDRGLHSRYECAEYGWQDGVDKCAERVPEQIFDADQMRAFADATHAIRASHGQAPAHVLHLVQDAFAEVAMAYPKAFALHKVGLADTAVRKALAAPLPQAAQQAPAGASAEPYGWLYDWTHSSATSRADTTYTGFTKDEAHARKHDNCLAIFAAPQPAPSADSVLEDAARYRWLRDESWAGYNSGNGTPKVYTIDGAGNRKMQLAEDAMDSAVDAARAAQKEGEKP